MHLRVRQRGIFFRLSLGTIQQVSYHCLMKDTSSHLRVLVIGPGPKALGGIASVIQNYHKTEFWTKYGCARFASTTDFKSRISKAVYASWRLLVFCTMIVTSGRPTAVSIHTSHSGSFYRKLAYLFICRIASIPAVLHVHPAAFFNYFQSGGQFRRHLIRLAGRLSAKILFLSDDIRRTFSSVFDDEKMEILSNPIDMRDFESARNCIKTSRPSVLFLGAIIPTKGVYDLVESIALIRQSVPDARFVFAGNREVDKLHKMITDHGLSDCTEILGWIDGEQKRNLLGSSWILCLPSYTEGVPVVILEAMASRLPIVTTPVGGIPNILEHTITAEFIEPGDVGDIARGVSKVLKDSGYASRLNEAAFSEVENHYSTEIISKQLDRIYANVCRTDGM